MIPDYQACMRPVLELLSDGRTWRMRDLISALEDEFQLTAEERAALIPSGKQRVMAGRVGWAVTYLVQAGLAERPARGQERITEAGLQVLRSHPERIDVKILKTYPSFREFLQRTRNTTDDSSTPSLEPAPTPADLIARAVSVNRAAVETEVLEAALSITPAAFEHLVIRLLGAMGYGQRGSLERTQPSNDGGIDGIISQDPLGLDRIYVQAKRWAADRIVDRPEIQKFAGALLGRQGDRGVYITTATFSRGARDEAERINARIELIDGSRLAHLLVQHGVGVQREETPSLVRLDDDFFEGL
ncbi:restriction endonuclease [Arachnia propionica]|uniref:Restriction endonuclease n=1 Tax=Arachnia propionica TaxID=1750 RepID=A0A3P1T7C1_9ACTN|nr:restriction endonuclease [Arachnia propionica]RRD04716.1 restriction endonuclease [Arachnia propionica]